MQFSRFEKPMASVSRATRNLLSVQSHLANIRTSDIERGEDFYGLLLGLRIIMDQGWIRAWLVAAGISRRRVRASIVFAITMSSRSRPISSQLPDGTFSYSGNDLLRTLCLSPVC